MDKYWCFHQPHKSQLSGYLYLTQQNQQEYILHPAKNLNIIFFVGALRVSPMAMWPSDMFSPFVQMRRRSTRCVCGIEDHTAPFLILFASCQSVWWDCPRSQSLTMDRNILEKGSMCNFDYLMSTFLNNLLLKPDDASMHHQVPKCIWITINPFDCKLYLVTKMMLLWRKYS